MADLTATRRIARALHLLSWIALVALGLAIGIGAVIAGSLTNPAPRVTAPHERIRIGPPPTVNSAAPVGYSQVITVDNTAATPLRYSDTSTHAIGFCVNRDTTPVYLVDPGAANTTQGGGPYCSGGSCASGAVFAIGTVSARTASGSATVSCTFYDQPLGATVAIGSGGGGGGGSGIPLDAAGATIEAENYDGSLYFYASDSTDTTWVGLEPTPGQAAARVSSGDVGHNSLAVVAMGVENGGSVAAYCYGDDVAYTAMGENLDGMCQWFFGSSVATPTGTFFTLDDTGDFFAFGDEADTDPALVVDGDGIMVGDAAVTGASSSVVGYFNRSQNDATRLWVNNSNSGASAKAIWELFGDTTNIAGESFSSGCTTISPGGISCADATAIRTVDGSKMFLMMNDNAGTLHEVIGLAALSPARSITQSTQTLRVPTVVDGVTTDIRSADGQDLHLRGGTTGLVRIGPQSARSGSQDAIVFGDDNDMIVIAGTGWYRRLTSQTATCAAGVLALDITSEVVRVDANGAACVVTIDDASAELLGPSMRAEIQVRNVGAGVVTFPDVAGEHNGPTACTTTGIAQNGIYSLTFMDDGSSDLWAGVACTNN